MSPISFYSMLLRFRRAVAVARIRPLRFFSTENGQQVDGLYEDEVASLVSEFMDEPMRKLREREAKEEEPQKDAVPKKVLEDRPAVFPEREGESEVDREIRAHNSSLHNLKQQTIVGRVVAVGKREVLVDLGWKDYQMFFKSELTLSQIYRKDDQMDQQNQEEHRKQSLRQGDELQFRIEEVGTPNGELFVSTRTMRASIRQTLVWEELREAFTKETLVQGRILNPCNGGYAVGIAGFVAFCPLFRISPRVARRVGVLQPFRITMMSEGVGVNLVVVDPSIMAVGRPYNV